MTRRRGCGRRALPLAAGLLLLVAGQAAGAPAAAPAWSSFTMQASRLGSTATAVVERRMVAAAAARSGFIDSPRGRPLEATQAEVQKLSTTVILEIAGGRRIRLENHLWSDPHTGSPLYLVRTRGGLKDYHQQFRFTREGVFRRQWEPASAREAAGPPESWTKRGEHFYPFPGEGGGCPPIIESSQLILLTEAFSDDPPGDFGPLCVFHKRQVHRVSVQPLPPQEVRFDYLEKRAEGETRRDGNVSAEGFRVFSRPIGAYRGSVEDFIRSGARVFIAPSERLPLMISGEMPLVGPVEMRLLAVDLR